MIFLGVDPGLSGALAVVDAEGSLLHLVDNPTLKVGNKREYDRGEIKRTLQGLVEQTIGSEEMGQRRVRVRGWPEGPIISCVELVHAMPGQGVVSMWRMGQGFELWCTAFTMLDIPWETVTPQRWKGVMLDGMPKDKDSSRFKAKQLWPDQAERFGRKKDDGRAEAALIAEYLRRQWVKR